MSLTHKEVGDREVHFTRRFKASPERLFAAHTDPELISQWMIGPDGWSMPECISEARVGGRIRFTWAKDDEAFTLTGEYLELDPPHRIVHTEDWGDSDMGHSVMTTTFEPDGEGTLMTLVAVYPSPEARAVALSTDMMEGMVHSYDRLDRISQG